MSSLYQCLFTNEIYAPLKFKIPTELTTRILDAHDLITRHAKGVPATQRGPVQTELKPSVLLFAAATRGDYIAVGELGNPLT